MEFASAMEKELCRRAFVSEQNTPIVGRLSLETLDGGSNLPK